MTEYFTNLMIFLNDLFGQGGEIAVRIASNNADVVRSEWGKTALCIGICDASEFTIPSWWERDSADLVICGNPSSSSSSSHGGCLRETTFSSHRPRAVWSYESGGLIVDHTGRDAAAVSSPSQLKAITMASQRSLDLEKGTVLRFAFNSANRSATVWLSAPTGPGPLLEMRSHTHGEKDDTLVAALTHLPRHLRLFAVFGESGIEGGSQAALEIVRVTPRPSDDVGVGSESYGAGDAVSSSLSFDWRLRGRNIDLLRDGSILRFRETSNGESGDYYSTFFGARTISPLTLQKQLQKPFGPRTRVCWLRWTLPKYCADVVGIAGESPPPPPFPFCRIYDTV